MTAPARDTFKDLDGEYGLITNDPVWRCLRNARLSERLRFRTTAVLETSAGPCSDWQSPMDLSWISRGTPVCLTVLETGAAPVLRCCWQLPSCLKSQPHVGWPRVCWYGRVAVPLN